MKKMVKALWMAYAAVLCFCFFAAAAAVSALLGLSEGQYVFLNGGLLAGFVLLVVLPLRLFLARRKTGGRTGSKKGRMHGRRRGGVRPALVCTAAFCLAAVLLAVRILRIPAGGHPGTVFWENLFCQIAGGMLAFGALTFLSGVWSAVFMLVGVIFLSPLATGIYVADPQNFMLLLAGAELVCIAFFCRFLQKGRGRGRKMVVSVWCGLLCGMCCLADIRLCAFLLFPVLPVKDAVSDQRERAGGRRISGRQKGLLLFLCAAAAGFLGAAAIWCAVFGKSHDFTAELYAFLRSWLFMDKARCFPIMLHSPLISEYIIALLAYLAAFLPLFFESARRTQKTVRWILPFLFLFVAEQAANIGLQGQALRFFVLLAMAGAAVTGIFVCREPAAIGVIMKRKQTALENSPVSPAPGEYLDNPLPVPKRHVKKEMNYGFEPAPEQMYYEIPVADNDDFDV